MASVIRVAKRFASYGTNSRKFFVGGNWKANGSVAQVQSVSGDAAGGRARRKWSDDVLATV